MSGCGCNIEIRELQEKKTLYLVLGINTFMFFFEIALGFLAQSTGLIADSLDMLADALVYSISLYAVGRDSALKGRAALLSGYTQIALAVLVLMDILRRFFFGSEPMADWMMGVGALALTANLSCLILISKHRQGDPHMRASWIFSKNDVLANIGIIFSGWLVWQLGSRLPDLLIGSLLAGMVCRGGLQIIRETRAWRKEGR